MGWVGCALPLGIATLATLGTAVYRSNVDSALGAVPPDTADAARESIDRAVDAAGHLPAEQSADLLAAARDAFTTGVHVVGIVSAILCAGLAILAIRAFKHVRNTDGGGASTTQDRETHPMCPRSVLYGFGEPCADSCLRRRADHDGRQIGKEP